MNDAMADYLKPIVEALIFASPEPITKKTLYRLLDAEPREDVDAALASVQADYDHPGGLQLVEVAGGYQIVTRPELHEWVRRLFHERTSQKLSVAALETLAVIAYKQPVTAIEIAEIRGVNTAGVIGTLMRSHLRAALFLLPPLALRGIVSRGFAPPWKSSTRSRAACEGLAPVVASTSTYKPSLASRP